LQVLAPALPQETRVLDASDWLSLDGIKLLARVCGPATARSSKALVEEMEKWSAHLRPLIIPANAESERAAQVVGRAAILPQPIRAQFFAREGVVTAGLLRAQGLYSIGGVLLGTPSKAARDVATALAPEEVLAAWATEQAGLLADTVDDPLAQQECASVVAACGGRTGPLKIASLGGRWVSRDEIAARSGIDPFFLHKLERMVEMERRLLGERLSRPLLWERHDCHTSCQCDAGATRWAVPLP